MYRGCIKCGAYFKKETDEETLQVLREHLEKCSEENPYLNDPNADGYEDF